MVKELIESALQNQTKSSGRSACIRDFAHLHLSLKAPALCSIYALLAVAATLPYTAAFVLLSINVGCSFRSAPRTSYSPVVNFSKIHRDINT